MSIFDQFDEELDTLGLRCPEPVMLVRKAVRHLPSGAILRVKADDPATTRDIPQYCHFMNHELVAQSVEQTPFLYLIKKS